MALAQRNVTVNAASSRAFGKTVPAPLKGASVRRASSHPRICRASHVARAVAEVNDQTFDADVLKAKLPVLVDFWAPWCGPCRLIAPLIEELQQEYEGRLQCVKLNTDESPEVATRYAIRSIPTLMLFKEGKPLDSIVGALPKAMLQQAINKYL